ncbi:HNH endonuclease [Lichenihabitans sp. PAMC28606]|uniref:HNH endonuclease signature motif containing protein n=1 Tax=Lichenihabitans sp. PAMC28606 TaxID=2880932 RepID=UPI001D0AFC68|nr:HNH endonuclease signature motif containing protein [Lichenihabitans sp. PAMC28606]UDL95525.1 HNH endonuclease [Lichenihabitans sp. PAMC28606]
MPSRKLTKHEAEQADAILERVKADITREAGDDPVLLFALRRRTFIRLMYWERSTPAERRKLQKLKYAEQDSKCAICGEEMEMVGSELDRFDPVLGYNPLNVQLVHHECHVADQADKGYT